MLAKFSDIAPHPDAELFDLVEKWHAAYEVWDKAHDEWSLAEDRLDAMEPELPEAIFYSKADMARGWRFWCGVHDLAPNGRQWHGNKIEDLRSVPMNYRALRDGFGDPEHLGFKRDQARANEIVAAWDAHLAAQESARHESGEAEAAQVAKAATAARNVIERQIINHQAKTMDGIKLRLDILARIYGDEGDFVRVAQFKAEQDALSAMPYATLRDLMEIFQAGRSHQAPMLQAAE